MKAKIHPFSIFAQTKTSLSIDIAVNRMKVPCIILNAIRNEEIDHN